jgi:hypothetical protein
MNLLFLGKSATAVGHCRADVHDGVMLLAGEMRRISGICELAIALGDGSVRVRIALVSVVLVADGDSPILSPKRVQ